MRRSTKKMPTNMSGWVKRKINIWPVPRVARPADIWRLYSLNIVMSDRPEVRTASGTFAVVDVAGLAFSMIGAMARLPFREPWRGPGGLPRNLAVSTTREFVRSLLGYASSLPTDEISGLSTGSPVRYCLR